MTVEDIKKEIERMQDVTKDIKVSVGNLRSDINKLEGAIKQDNDEFEARLAEAESRGAQKGYEKGFAEGKLRKKLSEAFDTQDDQYQRGYRDAWDLATRITLDDPDGGIPMEELKMVFGVGATYRIFKDFDCFEIGSKWKEHEKKKAEEQASIRVGDEVRHMNHGFYGIVLSIDRDKNEVSGICLTHSYKPAGFCWSKYDVVKTGCHHDFNKILEFLRS